MLALAYIGFIFKAPPNQQGEIIFQNPILQDTQIFPNVMKSFAAPNTTGAPRSPQAVTAAARILVAAATNTILFAQQSWEHKNNKNNKV